MALSLGDALLSFAGGAAKGYNERTAKEHEKQLRIEQRNAEIKEQLNARIAETQYLKEVHEDTANAEVLKSASAYGGLDTPAFQLWYRMNKLGEPEAIAQQNIRAGNRLNLSPDQFKRSETRATDPKTIAEYAATSPRASRRAAALVGSLDPEVQDDANWDKWARSVIPQEAPPLIPVPKGTALVGKAPDGSMVEVFRNVEDATEGMDSSQGKAVSDYLKLHKAYLENPDDEGARLGYETMKSQLEKENGIVMREMTVVKDGNTYTAQQAFVLDSNNGVVPIGNPFIMGPEDVASSSPTRNIEESEVRLRQLAETANQLDNLFPTQVAMTENMAGAFIDFATNISQQAKGLFELAGVDPETSPERLQGIFRSSGYDWDKTYEDLSKTNAFWRKTNKTSAGLLVYSVANILKDAGSNRITTEADVARAIALVGDLSSSTGGQAAYEQLRYYVDQRSAGHMQQIYEAPGVSPEQRRKNGIELLRLVYPDINDNLSEMVITGGKTGSVMAWTSPAVAQRARSIIMRARQADPERPIGDILSNLDPMLRPQTLEQLIQSNGVNGYLMPPAPNGRYLKKHTQSPR
jgi:hypothetical protein